MKKTVIVFGGTGHYGSHIVGSLIKLDVNVRILSRNEQNARSKFGKDVQVLQGDILSDNSIKEALEGVDSVVIAISAFSRALIRQLKEIEEDAVLSILRIASNMGIKRIVYISVFALDLELLSRLKIKMKSAGIKDRVESALKNSDFNWTVLGAPPSTEIFFAMTRGNKMIVPGGGPLSLPTISAADVGEIVAQTSIRDDLNGRRLPLCSSKALSFSQAANIISQVWERDIKVVKIPLILPAIVSVLSYPFTPYIRHLYYSMKLMNNFPQNLAKNVPEYHKELMDIFDYTPVSLEMEAKMRR